MRSHPLRPVVLAALVASTTAMSGWTSAAPAPVTAATAGLSIAVAPGDVTLLTAGGGDAAFDPDAAQVVTGALPLTTVTDVRALGGAWTVSVSSSAFVHVDDAGVTVAATDARAYLDAVDLTTLETDLLGLGLLGATIDAAALPGTAQDLSTTRTLLTGSSGLGGGTIVFEPIIEVTVPAATPAGEYVATVTQTVS